MTSSKNSERGLSFSKLALESIRLARRSWPFNFGKDFPNHLGAVATRLGLIGPEWFEFKPGLWMQLNVTDLIQETILLEGMWDPCLTNFIESNLKPGNVFIDIGAHVGYFTLLAANKVGDSGKVLAVEPNPFALKDLQQHVERSDLKNVVIEHSACGESNGVVNLFLHTESNTSMASLSNSNASGGSSVEVPCQPLDQLFEKHALKKADLIKVDVEGAELSVLRGMRNVMLEFSPMIVLELEPDLLKSFGTSKEQVLEFFAECGYFVESLGGHSNFVCRKKP